MIGNKEKLQLTTTPVKKRKVKEGEHERKVGERCNCKQRCCHTVSDEQWLKVIEGFWGMNSGMNTTLCISDKMIKYNLDKVIDDVRPKSKYPAAHNRFSDDIRPPVCSHINSFHKVESHHCRKSTKRENLDYLYKKSEFYNPQVKQSYYSEVFAKEFNLIFHQPSKDVCDFWSVRAQKKIPKILNLPVNWHQKWSSVNKNTTWERRKLALRESWMKIEMMCWPLPLICSGCWQFLRWR